jgi:nitrate reductase (NAD(P)H)
VPFYRVTESDIKNQKWFGKDQKSDDKDDKSRGKKADGNHHDDAKRDKEDDGNKTQKSDDKADRHGPQEEQSGDKDEKEDGKQSGASNEQASKLGTASKNEENKRDGQTTDADSKQKEGCKGDQRQESGQDPSAITDPGEHAFFALLKGEINMIAGLKNNPGLPQSDLKASTSLQDFRLSRRRAGDAMEIQVDDQFTPDSWIPRSSKLLRLTGKHPLNAEANLTELYDAGLITPTKLHYVRNHGAVPRLTFEEHRLEVFSDPPGLLEACSLTMEQLTREYPPVEIPVTLACDGNRR